MAHWSLLTVEYSLTRRLWPVCKVDRLSSLCSLVMGNLCSATWNVNSCSMRSRSIWIASNTRSSRFWKRSNFRHWLGISFVWLKQTTFTNCVKVKSFSTWSRRYNPPVWFPFTCETYLFRLCLTINSNDASHHTTNSCSHYFSHVWNCTKFIYKPCIICSIYFNDIVHNTWLFSTDVSTDVKYDR